MEQTSGHKRNKIRKITKIQIDLGSFSISAKWEGMEGRRHRKKERGELDMCSFFF